MRTIQSASTVKPPVHTPLVGPTVTLYRSNVTEEVIPADGDRPEETIYRYTELRFQPGEYDLVRQGSLPVGADAWTEDLRRIERSFLYDQADVMVSKAGDYDSPEWTAYGESMREYKRQVRDTVNQPNFPETVEYPPIPPQPVH